MSEDAVQVYRAEIGYKGQRLNTVYDIIKSICLMVSALAVVAAIGITINVHNRLKTEMIETCFKTGGSWIPIVSDTYTKDDKPETDSEMGCTHDVNIPKDRVIRQ